MYSVLDNILQYASILLGTAKIDCSVMSQNHSPTALSYYQFLMDKSSGMTHVHRGVKTPKVWCTRKIAHLLALSFYFLLDIHDVHVYLYSAFTLSVNSGVALSPRFTRNRHIVLTQRHVTVYLRMSLLLHHCVIRCDVTLSEIVSQYRERVQASKRATRRTPTRTSRPHREIWE